MSCRLRFCSANRWGRSRARPIGEEELAALDDQEIELTKWHFVARASRELEATQYSGDKTLEKDAELFVLELLRERGFSRCEQQVKLEGSSDPDNLKVKELRADVVGCSEDDGRRHFLVIEGEWTGSGGSQAAAQAYGYARRIKDPGPEAQGRTVFGHWVEDVQDDAVHAVVVANVVPARSLTADQLGVARMTYLDFAKLIAARGDLQLPVV